MDDVSDAFGKYEALPDSVQKPAVRDRYASFESDSHQLIKRISEYMREVAIENKTNSSVRSCRTASSGHSKASSINSVRVEAATEAAVLKAKLRHMRFEEQKRAELEQKRVELEKKRAELDWATTTKELEMAEAKLDAIARVASCDSVCEPPQAPSMSAREHVERYLETQTAENLDSMREVCVNYESGEKTSVPSGALMHEKVSSMNGHDVPPISDDNVHVSNGQVRLPIVNTQPTKCPNGNVQAGMNGFAPEFVSGRSVHPARNNVTSNRETSDLAGIVNALSEQVSLGRLPPPEPCVFMGDPLSYPVWKSSFHTLIGRKNIPPLEKVFYLKKYLGGAAKEAVEGYFLLSTDNAFTEAMDLLEHRYGNQFVVANAFRDKLDMWPKVPPRDGIALRKLADFLRQCNTALQTIPSLSFLNDERENRKILAKLPEWLTLRWGRYVSDSRDRRQIFPSFDEFVHFIIKEANIACDPVTSLSSVKTDRTVSEPQKFGRFERKRYAGATAFSTNIEEPKPKEKTGKQPICALCDGNHDVDVCKTFLQKSLGERKEFAIGKRLCFGCLCPGHRSKWCKQRKTCSVCSKRHPTSLHDDQWSEKVPITTKAFATQISTDLNSGSKSSMIVPVWISHRDRSEKEVMVYALLDTQSDTTFVLEDTCDELNVSGPEVNLRLSTMSTKDQLIPSRKIGNLLVRAHDGMEKIALPTCYTRNIMPANRSHIPTPQMAEQWSHLKSLSNKLMPLTDCKVGLLIGYNCPRALVPREVIPSASNEPFAQRTDLGWGIVGVVKPSLESDTDPIGLSHRILVHEVPSDVCPADQVGKRGENKTVTISFKTTVKEVINPQEILKMMELDFSERKSTEKTLSQEDRKFLSIVSNGIFLRDDGHYEMPLPFRDREPSLPNNKTMAIKRLAALKRRFDADSKYGCDYTAFMEDVIDKGLAEAVPESEVLNDSGQIWYIPHHGIYHPKKPEKIRVVFDCSALYAGQSLNDKLLQGPDLTNGLIGVLCRFRKEPIAVMCDIQQMFYQFYVTKQHQDFLRFLWWEGGDQTTEPKEYRMRVHLFGAVSSPGCANFGLKQTANDNEAAFGSEAAEFVRRDFYVDDGLKSTETVEKAVALIKNSTKLCQKGGLKLHKFATNSNEVLEKVPVEDRASGLTTRKLLDGSTIIERALGVQWCIHSDTFQFRIVLQDQPLTRRGILSTVSSVYDPMGFIAPVVLIGKQILQEMCRENSDWDSPLPDSLRSSWEKWRQDLPLLEALEVKRCFKTEDLGKVVSTELHHFSDASNQGYGQCSYLRLVDEVGHVSCALVMSKARVTPLKSVTIPRLELTAAVVSVKVSSFLRGELDMDKVTEVFWCDSKVVLGYISNESRRFHVFVANRVQRIREHTEASQWRYVKSEDNPADDASRGLSAAEFLKTPRWINGPDFLWDTTLESTNAEAFNLNENDPEIKDTKVMATLSVDYGPISGALADRYEYFSSWYHLTRAIANCKRYMRILKARMDKRKSGKGEPVPQMTTADLRAAECVVLCSVQSTAFPQEVKDLSKKVSLKSNSSLYPLDPFIDECGILRVGGRLKNAKLSKGHMFPAILPRKGHVTELLIRHFHKQVSHQGRGLTTNEIRSNGFWIIGCSAAVSSAIDKCVECRKLRRPTEEQKMADLPADRLTPAPPFTYCGIDVFGPFLIKEKRTELKRYGVLFTCMVSRAIHIETVNSLTSDAFISALRRFISVRGPVQQIRCDRGTNFVGAEHELRDALLEMGPPVKEFCLKQKCDFVEWKMNVPSASHFGGVWERQIRSVRNVLAGLMLHCGTQLDDESLRTFMCEAAAIVNSRPLSVNDLNDPTSLEPLTPNHLLTLKSKVILSPPGEFQREDVYSKKRWRRVQYMANEFWQRWKKEYVQNLQVRPKWNRERRELKVGDVVLIVDQSLPRCGWPLARVCEVFRSGDDRARKVKLLTSDPSLDAKGKRTRQAGYLERPVQKLILILPQPEDNEL